MCDDLIDLTLQYLVENSFALITNDSIRLNEREWFRVFRNTAHKHFECKDLFLLGCTCATPKIIKYVLDTCPHYRTVHFDNTTNNVITAVCENLFNGCEMLELFDTTLSYTTTVDYVLYAIRCGNLYVAIELAEKNFYFSSHVVCLCIKCNYMEMITYFMNSYEHKFLKENPNFYDECIDLTQNYFRTKLEIYFERLKHVYEIVHLGAECNL
jgi:hypothetical protein